jgi:uncharacterized protein HemY/cbb3-type cytochrome oxidase subunit 3
MEARAEQLWCYLKKIIIFGGIIMKYYMKRLKKRILIGGMLVWTILSCTRPNDALLLAEQFMNEQPDSALLLLESIQIGTLSPRQHADWCLFMTQARDKTYQEQTDSLIRIAVAYYEAHDNPARQMLAYYSMGRVSQEAQQATKAQEYYLKALEAGESSTDDALLGRICSNLGMLYTYQKACEQALPHLRQAETHFRRINDTNNLSFVLRDMARTYNLMKQPDSSQTYYLQALDFAGENSRFSILNELGDRCTDRADYSSAYRYITEALKGIVTDEDYPPVYLTLGKLFYKWGKPDSARYYLQQIIHSDYSSDRTRAGAYYYRYHLAKENHQWTEYAQYQERYESLEDSIIAQTHTETIQRMQFLFDHKQAEDEALFYKLKSNIYYRNMIIAGLFFIVITICFIAYFYYYFHRKRRIYKKQVEMRLKISEELQLRSDEEIQAKQQRIKELEHVVSNKEDLRMELDNYKLQLREIAIIVEKQELLNLRFKSSNIYIQLQNKGKNGKITKEDMNELKATIEALWPDFSLTLKILYPAIHESDILMCYLLKANVSQSAMANYLCITASGIGNKRFRLSRHLFGENAVLANLDKFIASPKVLIPSIPNHSTFT